MTLQTPDGRTVDATIVNRGPYPPVLVADGHRVSTSEARRFALTAASRPEVELLLWSSYRFAEVSTCPAGR